MLGEGGRRAACDLKSEFKFSDLPAGGLSFKVELREATVHQRPWLCFDPPPAGSSAALKLQRPPAGLRLRPVPGVLRDGRTAAAMLRPLASAHTIKLRARCVATDPPPAEAPVPAGGPGRAGAGGAAPHPPSAWRTLLRLHFFKFFFALNFHR